MEEFRLDQTLIDAWVSGALDADGEVTLAHQVARVLPFHWTLPNPVAAKLSRITKSLGGEQALFDWLGQQPGHPQLVARLYRLIVLLDHLSTKDAVLVALRELRGRTPYPPGLGGYLIPDTNSETLAGLSWQIERLLAEDRIDEAVRLAGSAVEMLQQIAPRAAEIDPDLGVMAGQLDQIRKDIVAVSAAD